MIYTKIHETISQEELTVMKRLLFLFILLVSIVPMITAAETTEISTVYDTGSQMFTFRFGPVVPTFMFRPDQDPQWLTFSDTRFKVGGYGAIRYQGFLNRHFALGGELGYLFDYDQSYLFTSVPFQAKLTYIPIQGTIEVPLSLGLGFAYNSYEETSFMSLLASAEAGISFFFSEAWGVTLSAGLQLIPEIYTDSRADQTTIAGFMPITLSLTYRGE